MPFSTAALARVLPFAAFMALLGLRGMLPEGLGVDARWIYSLNLLIVGGLLAWYWREYGELYRQNLPTLREAGFSAAIGLVVFALWIELDAPWMQLAAPTATFFPVDSQGALIWPLVLVRWLGAALLVPVMEELFWRSWLMRWLESPQFEAVAPQRVGLKAIALSTFVFMLAHTLWLAAIVAGVAYALLYIRTGKLWCAVLAHAVTNGALGIWVVQTRQWQFW